MRHFLCACLSALALTAAAQTTDPVIMTINGKPVTRGEFEYSYFKNSNVEGAIEQKSVAEYVDMFINYKLKVAAAEAAHMDTLSSFRREFLQYRDMQLTPYMVDQAFIDSVAHSIYDNTAKKLNGKDMIRVAHIMLMFKQNATDSEKNAAAQRADSIYNALRAGGDFASLAKTYSQDKQSAVRSGELPWMGPGMTFEAFEKAAYALQVGEYCAPVETPMGYHIIKMVERKQLEPFDSLYANIVAGLKRQGIEDASAENRIQKLVQNSGGRLTREMVMDSILNAHLDNPELRYLVQEYHDGLLLYEISKQQVWDKAASDEQGLSNWYKEHKDKYAWTEPRFKGFVIQAKDKKALKKAQKVLRKYGDSDWRKQIKLQCNKDSVTVYVTGELLCKQGENGYVDQFIFGGQQVPAKPGFTYTAVQGKKLKQPASYKDVKADVLTDYQESLEKAWVEQLRKRFPFQVDQAVLQTVGNHE